MPCPACEGVVVESPAGVRQKLVSWNATALADPNAHCRTCATYDEACRLLLLAHGANPQNSGPERRDSSGAVLLADENFVVENVE